MRWYLCAPGWQDLDKNDRFKVGNYVVIKSQTLLLPEFEDIVGFGKSFEIKKIKQWKNLIFFYVKPRTESDCAKLRDEIWPKCDQVFKKFLDLEREWMVCKMESLVFG